MLFLPDGEYRVSVETEQTMADGTNAYTHYTWTSLHDPRQTIRVSFREQNLLNTIAYFYDRKLHREDGMGHHIELARLQ